MLDPLCLSVVRPSPSKLGCNVSHFLRCSSYVHESITRTLLAYFHFTNITRQTLWQARLLNLVTNNAINVTNARELCRKTFPPLSPYVSRPLRFYFRFKNLHSPRLYFFDSRPQTEPNVRDKRDNLLVRKLGKFAALKLAGRVAPRPSPRPAPDGCFAGVVRATFASSSRRLIARNIAPVYHRSPPL